MFEQRGYGSCGVGRRSVLVAVRHGRATPIEDREETASLWLKPERNSGAWAWSEVGELRREAGSSSKALEPCGFTFC